MVSQKKNRTWVQLGSTKFRPTDPNGVALQEPIEAAAPVTTEEAPEEQEPRSRGVWGNTWGSGQVLGDWSVFLDL